MKSEYLIDRNGKTFCLYAGLLDEGHRQGLKRITTSLIQIPTQENGLVAICACEVETERGVFSGIGDASPQNVSRAMQTCLIRMAETRSKARALRDAVNVSAASVEELPEEEATAAPASGPAPMYPRQGPAPGSSNSGPLQSQSTASPQKQGGAPFPNTGRSRITTERPTYQGPDPVTPAQIKMIESLAERAGVSVQPDTLSRDQAAAMITELKAKVS